jgi:hypothetical protein
MPLRLPRRRYAMLNGKLCSRKFDRLTRLCASETSGPVHPRPFVRALMTEDMVTHGTQRLPNIVEERGYLITQENCAHVEESR